MVKRKHKAYPESSSDTQPQSSLPFVGMRCACACLQTEASSCGGAESRVLFSLTETQNDLQGVSLGSAVDTRDSQGARGLPLPSWPFHSPRLGSLTGNTQLISDEQGFCEDSGENRHRPCFPTSLRFSRSAWKEGEVSVETSG